MSALKLYGLFISHSWKYSREYEHMVKLLGGVPDFRWRNYSSPRNKPAIDASTEYGRNRLIAALRNQIRPVNCVIILSGMYLAHSYWIKKEINIAVGFSKPIIGVRPWGNKRFPRVVQNVATEIVGWNSSSVVDAIRRISL